MLYFKKKKNIQKLLSNTFWEKKINKYVLTKMSPQETLHQGTKLLLLNI